MSKEDEDKWLKIWQKEGVFEAEINIKQPKIFVNAPFPYMNGPLHIGHAFTYTRLDTFARYKRMRGYNVLFPFAWHWTGEAVAGQSIRLLKGDPTVIRAFVEIDGIPKEELPKFTSPYNLAEYYTQVSRTALMRLGLSIDWRREFFTTSYNKGFSKFIEWQYLKLRSKNYVIRGSHPVVWCPFDQSPTGDHDRLEGEGVSPEELFLVYFKMNEEFLAAATFRPETLYGATNVWILPSGEYVKAEIDGKQLIASEEFAQKIIEQERVVKIKEKLTGKDLIGKKCVVPLSGQVVPILPASFVDVNYGTGIVYSVPAHAPYDWLALRDIQRTPPDELKDIVNEIKPISIIRVEGFGEYPAIELVDQLQVKDQNDKQAEKATEVVYSKEFHTGFMKENCGPLSGMPVKDAKNKALEALIAEGLGDKAYDLPQMVKCRCGTRCIVKILKDQWFLNYSDLEWKRQTKELVNSIKVFPEESRAWYIATIDWLNNWPCARKTGMGTPMPWDKDWIIETLSDSTIYMAYYIISKYVNSNQIQPDQMIPEFFDYVFLGEGNLKELSEKIKLDSRVIERVREDFLYWYPVDLRNSAKELIPNHLTFFLFQHVAIFPKEMWPKGVSVNGMITIEGKKMSKSRGVFTTIAKELDKYGADVVRATLVYGAEGMDDPDWNEDVTKLMQQKIKSLSDFVLELKEKAVNKDKEFFEKLLLSEIKSIVLNEEKCLEEMKTKSAFQLAFFDFQNVIRRYLKQVGTPERSTTEQVIEIWIKILAPFIPFTCEELWKQFGHRTLISKETWPFISITKEDKVLQVQSKLVEGLITDIKEIQKIAKTKSNNVYIYVAPKDFTTMAINYLTCIDEGLDQREALKRISGELRDKRLLNNIPLLIKLSNIVDKGMVKEVIDIKDFNELEIYQNSKQYIEKETGTVIKIFSSDQTERYDPKHKARNAIPFRPAIYIEEGGKELL
ncbi:MAG: leucine--tRNA ligase [Nitrososphaeria archaeon]